MFDVFGNAVLPIFAVVACGYVMARFGMFDVAHASAINRFVFYLPLPLLLFRLIATTPLDRFEWLLILVYLLVEIVLYAFGFAVARLVFKRTRTESLLLGMASMFPNHVYFVLPIAQTLYGETAVLPVVALITVDAVLLFGGTVMILDATSEKAKGASFVRVAYMLARNPQVIAIVLGVAANASGLELKGGWDLFSKFLGNSAAPASLFALGVILAMQQSTRDLKVPLILSSFKLFLIPAAVWLAFAAAGGFDPIWTAQALLVAAGPAGAMPFVLALQYQVPVHAIARIVLFTTVGSLITVTAIAQLAP